MSQAQTLKEQQTREILHYMAVSCVVMCPVLAILPPRRLNIFTFGLLGGTGVSANHLLRESTGRSFADYLSGSSTNTSSEIQQGANPGIVIQDASRQHPQEELREVTK